MADTGKYINLINEIIAKQALILGADIVLIKAKNVPGLVLDQTGTAETIHGDPQVVLQSLISEYMMTLSGQIVRNILDPILAKYPDIKVKIN